MMMNMMMMMIIMIMKMFHGTGVVNQNHFCQQGIRRPDDDDEDDQDYDDDGDDYEDVASSSRITFNSKAL